MTLGNTIWVLTEEIDTGDNITSEVKGVYESFEAVEAHHPEIKWKPAKAERYGILEGHAGSLLCFMVQEWRVKTVGDVTVGDACEQARIKELEAELRTVVNDLSLGMDLPTLQSIAQSTSGYATQARMALRVMGLLGDI